MNNSCCLGPAVREVPVRFPYIAFDCRLCPCMTFQGLSRSFRLFSKVVLYYHLALPLGLFTFASPLSSGTNLSELPLLLLLFGGRCCLLPDRLGEFALGPKTFFSLCTPLVSSIVSSLFVKSGCSVAGAA